MEVDELIQSCNQSSTLGSSDRKDCILRSVQDQVILKYIALFTYLALVTLVGVIGNSLILAVYFRRTRKTATIVFIEAIAVTDLLTNILVIPVTYYVLMKSVAIETYLCRIYYFLNYSTSFISVVLLLAVAVVRYRKICLPFAKQVTAKHARLISMGIALLCITLCVPHTIVSGRATVQELPQEGISIYECAIDDYFVESLWTKVVNGFSIFIFLMCCVPVTVMYSKIGIEAQRRRPTYGHGSLQRRDVSESAANSDSVKDHLNCKIQLEKENATSSLSRDNDTSLSEQKPPPLKETRLQREGSSYFYRSQRGAWALNRTTLMLLTISVIYILTNLTTLVLICTRSLIKMKISSLSVLNASIFSICLYLFILNSAVNAIIYIALDRNFRIDCVKLIKGLWQQ
nr:neuropeptide Y receptor type 5-like [Biomphalaria glabrata]